jgi:hypothetical protein
MAVADCACSSEHLPHERLASTGTCYACLFAGLSQPLQAVVDQSLAARHFLLGMKTLRDNLPIDFRESKSLYIWRYKNLHKTQPSFLPYLDTEYWMIG